MFDVPFTYEVIGNQLIITPVDGICDNSVYEIEIEGLSSFDGLKKSEDFDFTIVTKVSPLYSTVQSVQDLVSSIGLPDDLILRYVRDASRKADYISCDGGYEVVPYQVEQFVRYQAAHDALLRYYIDKSTMQGRSGKMGEVEFDVQHSMSGMDDLFKTLKAEAAKWEEEAACDRRLAGARPRATVKSAKNNMHTKVYGLHRESTSPPFPVPPIRGRYR